MEPGVEMIVQHYFLTDPRHIYKMEVIAKCSNKEPTLAISKYFGDIEETARCESREFIYTNCRVKSSCNRM